MPKILIAVISGLRPLPSDRITERWLPELAPLGDIEFVVREDQAEGYVMDPPPGVTYTLNPYSVSWADEYARTHWRHPRAEFIPGGFHGAFTGREWAMHTAAERGYDVVIQLDDNIQTVGVISSTRTHNWPGMSRLPIAQTLIDFTQSTNLRMVGMNLSSSVPTAALPAVRTGFPYSFFAERVDGRNHYHGPFEDDIMQAMEYGLYGPSTAGLVPGFAYAKESHSTTGMRAKYDNTRGLELPKRYPKNARLIYTRKTSSPLDKRMGVRHFLNTSGFTPIRVRDRELFDATVASVSEQVTRTHARIAEVNREKIARRAGLLT